MDKSQSGSSGQSGTGSLVTEQVKQGTQQAAQQTQQAAGQVAESAKSTAVSYADSQKQTATQGLHSVADALHGTGKTLESSGPAPVANYANQAGDKVDEFAQYLEQTSVQSLIGDAEKFARQHSSLFLGGALAIGFAASRFIKASTPSSGGSGNYGSGNYGNRGYGQSQMDYGNSYASSAPYSDVGYSGTPSNLGGTSGAFVASEVEMPDATVFNADLETETSDGTAH
jgi:hypothetical protein